MWSNDSYRHCNKHHDKKEKDKNGLLTEFDFDEFNQNQNPFPGPGLIPLANTDLCINDKCDRVLLNAAINWAPAGTATATLNLSGAISSGLFLEPFQTRFTIWRGNPFNPNGQAVPICSFVDSSPFNTTIMTVDVDPTTPGFQLGLSFTIGFSPVTTDFKCVDENPECGKVEYFLTMVPLDFIDGVSLTGATAVTFTAMEIEKHDDDCCDCC
ncbi:hypothetical protein V7128_21575 [Neobacillus vireti]|uniref:hypothetical protein n=1 Tax=Neobacillus vireti TaxID=220686 RepID=UPI002FFF365A